MYVKKNVCVNIYILIFYFSFCISLMRTVSCEELLLSWSWCLSRSFMVAGVRNPFQNS